MHSSRWYTPVNYHQAWLKDTNRYTLSISNCPIDAVNPAVTSSQSQSPVCHPQTLFIMPSVLKAPQIYLTWLDSTLRYIIYLCAVEWIIHSDLLLFSRLTGQFWRIKQNRSKASQLKFSLSLILLFTDILKLRFWWIACRNCCKWWDKTPISAEQADANSYSPLNRLTTESTSDIGSNTKCYDWNSPMFPLTLFFVAFDLTCQPSTNNRCSYIHNVSVRERKKRRTFSSLSGFFKVEIVGNTLNITQSIFMNSRTCLVGNSKFSFNRNYFGALENNKFVITEMTCLWNV